MKPNHYEVIIVGAGPIGIEIAVALKKAGIDYLHLEKGQIGQTISWFPRMMRFFSSPDRIAIAGIPIPRIDESKCTKEEYLAYLRSVVVQFGLPIRTYEKVVSINRQNDEFIVNTVAKEKKHQYTAHRLILAVGDMHKPNLLGIPGEDLPHVSHYFDEPHKYFRQKVIVTGGRNSAVEAALRCFRCGADVTICYRGSEFDPESVKYWILPEIQGLINRGEIKMLRHSQVKAIGYDSVTIEEIHTGKVYKADTDFVLLMTGYRADMSLFTSLGVELAGPEEKPVYDESTMETNIPGLYVAGTAVAGSQQKYSVFIENCHIHVERIFAALTCSTTTGRTPDFERPES
ncbi:MAG: YpdA family putative bacillithiol disulfide reductase [Candidatus Latescibacteria bacterium]|nr:YpdA family putative bacillithiol disulfide reductase [Candidatus Latescibacterota bacterium]